MTDFAPFLAKTLVGSHGQDLLIEGKVNILLLFVVVVVAAAAAIIFIIHCSFKVKTSNVLNYKVLIKMWFSIKYLFCFRQSIRLSRVQVLWN